MKLEKVILVGVNLSHLDQQVIGFASIFFSISKAEKMIFYHVVDDQTSEKRDLEAAEAKVREKVKAQFADINADQVNVLVEYGNPGELLVNKTRENDIDLILLGRKTSERNKILTSKLINSSGSALLLVPENAKAKISNIVVGVDFSEESHISLTAAISIANALKAEIHCLNIYHVPSGYHTSGKSYDEYAEIMKNNAIKASEKFKKKHQHSRDLNFDFVLDDDTDPADKLYAYAQKIHADLICLGSRGMDNLASVFFDTTAEKIVEYSNYIPMLIVKGKNKNRSLLDAIREL